MTARFESDRQVVCIGGLPFDVVDMAQAVDRICRAVTERRPLFLSTPNLNFLMAAQADAAFRDSVVHSDLSIADGMPLVWLARLLGLPIRERVAGASLFEALRQGAASACLERPISVYFFGGPPGVAERAAAVLNAEGRHMVCAGFHNPGFGSVEDMSSPDIIAAINASGADFLVVSLGAKKGQAWIERNRRDITVPVISHLGAVVNFVAGTVRRAPLLWQRFGLEWMWRIKEEPALFRRYWNDGKGFLRLLREQALPCILERRRGMADAVGACTIETAGDRCILIFAGAIGESAIAGLRFLPPGCRHVVCRMAGVSSLSPAFFAWLLLLKKSQDEQGASLALEGLSPEIRRSFRRQGLAYFIDLA